MNLERNIRMIGRSINVVYYTIYLLTIFVVLIAFYLTYAEVPVAKIDPLGEVGSAIQSVYLVFLLISIPATLYLYHKHTIKLSRLDDTYTQLKRYKKAATTRIWIVGAGLVIGVALVFILQSQSMIFSAAIAAIALCFCKPSRTKLIRELDLDVYADDKPGNKYV